MILPRLSVNYLMYSNNFFMAFDRVPQPIVVTLGQQYHVGEKTTVILYTYINRHAETPNKTKTQNAMRLDDSLIYCIQSRIGWVSVRGIYKSLIKKL